MSTPSTRHRCQVKRIGTYCGGEQPRPVWRSDCPTCGDHLVSWSERAWFEAVRRANTHFRDANNSENRYALYTWVADATTWASVQAGGTTVPHST